MFLSCVEAQTLSLTMLDYLSSFVMVNRTEDNYLIF